MRAHGYSPLPLNGKAPQIAAWQKRSDATDREIRSWAHGRPTETNTGLLTRNNPAFDIDILSSADAAQAVADLIAEELARSWEVDRPLRPQAQASDCLPHD